MSSSPSTNDQNGRLQGHAEILQEIRALKAAMVTPSPAAPPLSRTGRGGLAEALSAAASLDSKMNGAAVPLTQEERDKMASIYRHVAAAPVGSGVGGSLLHSELVLRSLEKRLGICFRTATPNQLWISILDACAKDFDHDETAGSSWASKITHVNRAMVFWSKAIPPELDVLRRFLSARSNTKAKVQKKTNKFMGCVPLTSQDMLHIFNTILGVTKARGGGPGSPISTLHLQTFLQIKHQRLTSRRVIESHFILPASFSVVYYVADPNDFKKFLLKEAPLSPDDKIVCRKMEYQFAWSKGLGMATYNDSFGSVPDGNYKDQLVAQHLLYMQRCGMIASASDVWHGRTRLSIDPNKWETTEDLVSALKRARTRIFNLASQRLNAYHESDDVAHKAEERGDGDEEDDDDESNEKGFGWLSLLGKKVGDNSQVFYEIAAEERMKHGKQVYWVHFVNGRPTRLPR